MKIRDHFVPGRPLVSFEFFPPKNEKGAEQLFQTVSELEPLAPGFVSVTYGAGGSTRQKTLEIVGRIKRETGLEAMAHLTCVGHGRAEIQEVVDTLVAAGVENILALRGDPPRGEAVFVRAEKGFAYASELVAFIRELGAPVCLGGACYPEVHPEARDAESDLARLKTKVDAGLDFLVTQLFFSNEDYFRFVDRARAIGITVPIVPGIMPVTNFTQVKRFTEMCGAQIPAELERELAAVSDSPDALAAVGIGWATDQCRELLARGAPGLHFYTLNRSTATRAIHARLFASADR